MRTYLVLYLVSTDFGADDLVPTVPFIAIVLSPLQQSIMKLEYLPMTQSARDALIAGSFLWFLFAITVGFRLLGRVRGIGLGADDVLSLIALVSKRCIHRLGLPSDDEQFMSLSSIGLSASGESSSRKRMVTE